MMVEVKQIVMSELPDKGECKRCAFISDIHLGHRRTPTGVIIATLYKYLVNVNIMSTLDVVFICGDLFDSLLTLPNSNTAEINTFISDFLRMAARFKVPIRAVYGTPSHDWGQTKILIEINEDHSIGADVLYFDKLCISDDPTLNVAIGYVPDEWGNGCESTLTSMKELMAVKGYDKLAILIMHGQFFFQVPEVGRNLKTQFDQEAWTDLADLIVIGHDHRFKYWNNIIVPSSIERLSHGEEETKGFLIAHIGTNAISVYHIANEQAMMYKTVGDALTSDTEIVKEVEGIMASFNGCMEPIGRIMVKHSVEYDFTATVKEWNTLYPNIIVDSKPDVQKKRIAALIDETEWSVSLIAVTAENVKDIVNEYSPNNDISLDAEIDYIKSMM